jgi:hypothetical protein
MYIRQAVGLATSCVYGVLLGLRSSPLELDYLPLLLLTVGSPVLLGSVRQPSLAL